jgi:hypothetical protein
LVLDTNGRIGINTRARAAMSEYSKTERDLGRNWYTKQLTRLEMNQENSSRKDGTIGDTVTSRVQFEVEKKSKSPPPQSYSEEKAKPPFAARMMAKFSSWVSIRKPLDRWTERQNFSYAPAGIQTKEQRHTRHALKKAEMLQRIIAAICGGALLVAPMLIMAIHPSKTKSLATSSTFVFVFGLGLAFFSASKASELLAATAAYAALLVVFVGVSGS